MFNKGGKHREDNEPEEKTENGFSMEQITKGKRKRSHSESEVDTQKLRERKRRRTISESSADSADTEQRADTKQKQQDLQGKDRSKSKEMGDKGLVHEPEGKDKKEKKSVRWEENEQGGVDKEKSGVTTTLGHKRTHDDSQSEENVEQKRQRMSEESGEDETPEGSKKHKKRKRKKKEKKETRLPHLRVISKLVTNFFFLNSPTPHPHQTSSPETNV